MRRASKRRSNGYFVVMLIVCALAFVLFFNTVGAKEAEQPVYYTSVAVHSGDSLWSIAETYAAELADVSTEQYVRELKKINNLKSDFILAGSYLTVYYRK